MDHAAFVAPCARGAPLRPGFLAERSESATPLVRPVHSPAPSAALLRGLAPLMPLLVYARRHTCPAARRRRRGRRLCWSDSRGRSLGVAAASAAVTAADPPALLYTDKPVRHRGRRCRLVEWSLSERFAEIEAWLDDAERGGVGENDEVRYWRRQTVMTARRRLQAACGIDFDGRGSSTPPGLGADGQPKVLVLQLAEEGSSEEVLALAVIANRPFQLSGLQAVHLERLLSAPEAATADSSSSFSTSSSLRRGAGASLVRGVARIAAEEGRVLTVEPQSEALEGYFSRLGFRQAGIVDPYLWFFAGEGDVAAADSTSSIGEADERASGDDDVADDEPIPAATLQLRYPLAGQQDYDRLLGAFKRNPLWIGSCEEVYISSRLKQPTLDVLAVRIARLEASAHSRASVTHFRRERPGEAFVPGQQEGVDVVEAMSVMRNPGMLDREYWVSAARLQRLSHQLCIEPGSEGSSDGAAAGYTSGGGGHYVVEGRCTVNQRAYPLPGSRSKRPDNVGAGPLGLWVGPSGAGASGRDADVVEMVVEALELPMMPEPIYSVVVTTTLASFADDLQALNSFFAKFKVRAQLRPECADWNLELVQSDGRAAAVFQPSEEPEETDPFFDDYE